MTKTIVLIPARMASTRLPGKPLADVGGRPMIVEVARRAALADVGPVVVATDSPEIVAAVTQAGYAATLTVGDHQSGSDRIVEALARVPDVGSIERVVNLQGDLPTIDPAQITTALSLLDDPAVDIATLCAEITVERERTDPNVVKLVGSLLKNPLEQAQYNYLFNPNVIALSPGVFYDHEMAVKSTRLRALYFTRATAPWGEGPHYHHIGLYAYRRDALERFVAAPQSTLEKRERLEQLRALELGMRIDAEIVTGVPLGVDTPHDLERAREILRNEEASRS